jgi:hypothetical protein
MSICFQEHKNTKLNHFNSISKEAKFRVLHLDANLGGFFELFSL